MTRVLVIKPSSLGDVIHALPAVALIRERLGSSLERLSWVVNDSFSGLLRMSPLVDRLVPFPRKTMWRRGVLSAFKRELQSESYDVAIDFQGLLRSGLMAKFSRAPRTVGFADGREFSPWFYTERIRVPKGHAVEKNLKLADAAFPASDGQPHWQAPSTPLLRLPQELLDKAGAMLGVAPGAAPVLAVGHSSRWDSKNWPLPFFAGVLDSVSRQCPQAVIWLLGAPNEEARAAALVEACRVARPLNLTGRSDMAVLLALLASSQALLTNDSGPMHLAAALDVPVVALFGATNPGLTGPYGPPGRHEVVCSVCEKSPCFKHICPYGEERCSRGISVDETAAKILERLCGNRFAHP